MNEMLAKAKAKHGPNIRPCHGKSWKECLTEDLGRIIFWYNDENGSTHILSKSIA